MPDLQPVASGAGAAGAWAPFSGDDNPFAPATPTNGPASGGSAIDPSTHPDWTAGDLVNGAGLLGVSGPPFDSAATAKAQADIDNFVTHGFAQRMLGAGAVPASAGPAVTAPTPNSTNQPPPAGQQVLDGLRTGFSNDFKSLIDGVVQAGRAFAQDPLAASNASALQNIKLLTPFGQSQALKQAGRVLGQNYQAADDNGTLPHFFGDLGGHAAAKVAQYLVLRGAGKAAEAATAGSLAPQLETPGLSRPPGPYNRLDHYGRTPTLADRKALGAGAHQAVNHDPPLAMRWYEGDPLMGEKPGWQMTPEERAASAADRSRMNLQPRTESNAQGGQMAQYSKGKKKELGF